MTSTLRSLARAARAFAQEALYRSGMLWLLARIRLHRRILVLTYHRVLPAERLSDCYSSRGIIVSPASFDRQLRFLKRHFHPLTAGEFIAALRAPASAPRNACLVTFDDGWQDMKEFVLPALRRHGIPAVLFLPVDHVGSRRGFWQERVARVLHARPGDPTVRKIVADAVGAVEWHDVDGALRVVARLKRLPTGRIEEILAAVEAADGGTREGGEDRFLDWDDVAKLHGSGLVTIGSHARSHRPLTRLTPEEARRELEASIREIVARIGARPLLLAYPNGDADARVAAIAAAAGFEAAFVTERGLVEAGSPAHLLRRVNIHESAGRTDGAFLARLLGMA